MVTMSDEDYFLPCFLPSPRDTHFLKVKSLNLEEGLFTSKDLFWF